MHTRDYLQSTQNHSITHYNLKIQHNTNPLQIFTLMFVGIFCRDGAQNVWKYPHEAWHVIKLVLFVQSIVFSTWGPSNKIQFRGICLLFVNFPAQLIRKLPFITYSFLPSVTQTRGPFVVEPSLGDNRRPRPGSDRSFYRIVSVTLTAPHHSRSRHVWAQLAGPAQENTSTWGEIQHGP